MFTKHGKLSGVSPHSFFLFEAVCLTGWTVSDANLTPQKQWLSFQQRN